jgi:hydroxymethylglutaryl-CoA lyase
MSARMNSQVWNGQGRRVHLQEVGTHDGWQVEAAFVSIQRKIDLVNAHPFEGCFGGL